MKRRKRSKNKTKKLIIIVFVSLCLLMSGAYAFLSQNLEISGKASISGTIINEQKICQDVNSRISMYFGWKNGDINYYNYEITIRNNSDTRIETWHIALPIPSDGKVYSISNAEYKIENNSIYLSNKDYNGYLNSGDMATIGLIIETKDQLNSKSLHKIDVYDCFFDEKSINDVDLNARIEKQNMWQSNDKIEVQYNITVSAPSDIKYWKLEIKLPESSEVSNLWNGNYVLKDNILTITNASYNGNISSSNSSEIGMIIKMSSDILPIIISAKGGI